ETQTTAATPNTAATPEGPVTPRATIRSAAISKVERVRPEIGSSNNPISGLTLSTLLIAALLMVALGVTGPSGVAAVLGVAAVVCVSAAVAGELLQDFKVGYILGGTPRKIQIAELVAVVVASLVMYWPLMLLHQANINGGGIGFGDRQLPAVQSGLMATLAMGIVGGDMPWPL